MELPLYQCRQAVDPFPQICVPTGNVYPSAPLKSLNIGDGIIDLYQEIGPEMLRILVELLRQC